MFTLAFFICWFLNVSHQMIFNFDCIDASDNGAKYFGNVSTTEKGFTCQRWDVNSPWPNVEDIHQKNNYCRNVNSQPRTWCYTTSRTKRFDWCNIPTCVVTCSRQSLNTDPDVIADPDINSYNNNRPVTLTCKPGYTGTSVTATCTATDVWSGNPITCIPITCSRQSLHKNRNVMINPDTNSYNYNQSVTLSCKPGYTGTSVTTTCTTMNVWSWNFIRCLRVPCPPLNNSSHPIKTSMLDRYFFGDEVQFQCDTGYTLVDGSSPVLKCIVDINNKSTGMWNDTQPSCSVLYCPKLNLSEHVNVVRPAKVGRYSFGKTVHLQCEIGFSRNGPPNITCVIGINSSTIKWNRQPPICKAKLCPLLSDTAHLKRVPNQTEYHYGEEVTFACESDFRLSIQSPKLTCGVEGTSVKWIGEVPTCEALPQQSPNIAVPVGGAVGGIVMLVIIVFAVIFFKRRQPSKPKQQQDDTSENMFHGKPLQATSATNMYAEVKDDGKENVYYNNADTENAGYYSFSTGLRIPKSAIMVKDFYKYVENGRGNDGKIEKEFMKLKSGLQKPTVAALKAGNKAKNKYKNMYAYDETRVVLAVSGSEKSDYVNASFIHGSDGVKRYIASQGPLDNTVDDVWRMVWQYDCGKIVMLTNIFEDGKHKCIQYWPDPDTSKVTYGDIDISMSKEDVYSDFTVRTLKMQKDNKTKTVQQFHFTAWPDKDVPKYASSLVHFRYKVNSTKVTSHGPMVVHCSAGIGRTGTFIGLDYALKQSEELDYVDVFGCVEGLRNQRVNMVQTQHQYMFLHEAVLEALLCPNTGIPSIEFPAFYKDLMEFDNKQKKCKLLIEYEEHCTDVKVIAEKCSIPIITMNSIFPRHDEDVFDKGKTPENKPKNRYSNIIPVGSEMPMLSTFVDGHNEYINAVFLPGYRSNKMFIITQMPMKSTIADLWRLVYDYDIPTIVMLNLDNCTENQYWPEKDTPVTFGPFQIQQTEADIKEIYNSLSLTLSYKQKETRKVHLFQSKFWDDEARVPSSPGDIITLINKVEEGHDKRGRGPTLVHCLNGCDKSGLYCVLATVIERLRIEQDVDTQHIIKQMRNRRPQIIPNFEQFQFIYGVVMEYMKQFETYSNFQ